MGYALFYKMILVFPVDIFSCLHLQFSDSAVQSGLMQHCMIIACSLHWNIATMIWSIDPVVEFLL